MESKGEGMKFNEWGLLAFIGEGQAFDGEGLWKEILYYADTKGYIHIYLDVA